MNCEVARILAAFQRPGSASGDLTHEDSSALDRHLAGCPSCAARLAAERKFEASVGAAIRAVPIPSGLHDRLVIRIESKQSARFKRKLIHSVAGIAAVFLAIPLSYGIFLRSLPAFSTEELVTAIDHDDLPEQETSAWLVGQGLPAELPLPFDFRLHRLHGKERIFGRDVPVVMFETLSAQGQMDWVRVYIVRSNQFDLRDAAKLKNARGSLCAAEVISDPNRPDVKFIVVYSSQNLDPFLKTNSHQLTFNPGAHRKHSG